MLLASRLLAALVVAGLFAAPIYADVIPSRHPTKSDAGGKVQARLVELGLPAAEAKRHADELTSDEAALFAANPDRLQLAGQEMWAGQSTNLWWEWVFGIISLGASVWTIMWFTRDGSS